MLVDIKTLEGLGQMAVKCLASKNKETKAILSGLPHGDYFLEAKHDDIEEAMYVECKPDGKGNIKIRGYVKRKGLPDDGICWLSVTSDRFSKYVEGKEVTGALQTVIESSFAYYKFIYIYKGVVVLD